MFQSCCGCLLMSRGITLLLLPQQCPSTEHISKLTGSKTSKINTTFLILHHCPILRCTFLVALYIYLPHPVLPMEGWDGYLHLRTPSQQLGKGGLPKELSQPLKQHLTQQPARCVKSLMANRIHTVGSNPEKTWRVETWKGTGVAVYQVHQISPVFLENFKRTLTLDGTLICDFFYFLKIQMRIDSNNITYNDIQNNSKKELRPCYIRFTKTL